MGCGGGHVLFSYPDCWVEFSTSCHLLSERFSLSPTLGVRIKPQSFSKLRLLRPEHFMQKSWYLRSDINTVPELRGNYTATHFPSQHCCFDIDSNNLWTALRCRGSLFLKKKIKIKN